MATGSKRSRAVRLEKQLKVALAERMQDWSRENVLGGLATLNHVDLNSDFSVAKVHVSFLGDVDAKSALGTFSDLAKRDRGVLTRRLGLIRAPRLDFLHDTSPDFRERLDTLMVASKRRGERQ